MPKTTVSRPSVKPRATPQKTTTKRTRKQLTSGPTHSRHVAAGHDECDALSIGILPNDLVRIELKRPFSDGTATPRSG